MTNRNPLDLDRFTVCLDNGSGYVVISDRDLTPINGATADAILGDSEASVIWNTSDRLGCIVFEANDAGWAMAQTLCDQLNDLDAAADASQAAALIDSAATLAESIEAEATPDLTPWQRRGLAAYQRAVSAGLWYRGEPSVNFDVGDRITIGHVPPTDYERGVLCALGVPWWAQGATATVILPAGHRSEMIVLLDDRDDAVALPSYMLYVRRAGDDK